MRPTGRLPGDIWTHLRVFINPQKTHTAVDIYSIPHTDTHTLSVLTDQILKECDTDDTLRLCENGGYTSRHERDLNVQTHALLLLTRNPGLAIDPDEMRPELLPWAV